MSDTRTRDATVVEEISLCAERILALLERRPEVNLDEYVEFYSDGQK